MKYLKKAVFVSLFFCMAEFFFAEEYELTVQKSVELALKNNIDVKNGEINLGGAERNYKYSWNSLSPSLGGTASYSIPYPNDNDEKAKISVGAKASVSFSTNLYTSVQSAKVNYEKEKISYEDTLRAVELSVRKAFYSIVFNQEKIKIQKKSLKTAKEQYESNLAKYNRGTLSRLDVLNAQVTYQNAELSVESLETTLAGQIDEFKQVVGIPLESTVCFSGDFESVLKLRNINAEDLKPDYFSLKILEKQLEGAKVGVLSSRFSAYSPSLTAGYSYAYSSADGGENWNDGGTISLGASIPLDGIFPWSSSSLKIDDAKDNVKSIKLKLENEKTSLNVKVSGCLSKIKQIQSSIGLRRSSIELAQSSYEMTLESYNHGTKDLLALQTARDSLMDAQLNLLQEAYNLICSVLELENITGLEYETLGK